MNNRPQYTATHTQKHLFNHHPFKMHPISKKIGGFSLWKWNALETHLFTMHKLVKIHWIWVSGMWELVRSLGFTSTLYQCFFFVFFVFLSFDDFHGARTKRKKNTSREWFLIIFSSRAFSAVLHHDHFECRLNNNYPFCVNANCKRWFYWFVASISCDRKTSHRSKNFRVRKKHS